MAGEFFINKLTGNEAWTGTLPVPTPADNPTDGPWKHIPGTDLSRNQTTTNAINNSHYWLMDGEWNQHNGNLATFFGSTGSVFKAYPGCSPEWTSFFHLPSSPFDENGGLQNALYILNPGQYVDLGTGQTRTITLTHGDGITGDGTGAVVEVSLRDLGTYTRLLQAEVVNPGSGYTTVSFDLTGKPAGVAATTVGQIGYLSWTQHAPGIWKIDLSTGFYTGISSDGNVASPPAGLMNVRGVWDRTTDKRLRLARSGCITKITLPADFVTTFVTPPPVVVTTTGGGLLKAVAVLDPTAAVGTARRVTDIRITYQEAGSTADPSSLTINAVTVNGVVYERIDATPTADITAFSWRWDTTGRVLYVGGTTAPNVKIVAGPNSGTSNVSLLALANRGNYEFYGITFRGSNFRALSFGYSAMHSLGLAVTGCTFSHPPVVRWGDTLTFGSNGSGQFPFYLSALALGCSYGPLYGTIRQFQIYGNRFLGSWNTEANDPSDTPFGMQFTNAGIVLTGSVGSPAFTLPGETNPIRWNYFEEYAGAGIACLPANVGSNDFSMHNLLVADNEFTAPTSRSFRPLWIEPGPYASSINVANASRSSGGPITTAGAIVTTTASLLEGMGLTNATLNADVTGPGPLYLKQIDNRRSIRLVEGAPAYSNLTTYVSGNVVYSSSPEGCYKCILGHKNQPVTNGTYWTALTLSELPVSDARTLKTGMVAYGDYCASIAINSIDYANNLVTLASSRGNTNTTGELTFFFNARFEIGGSAAASLTNETIVAYHKAAPNNIVIRNNKIRNVPQGMQVSGNNVWIHDNIFHRVRGDSQYCALRGHTQYTYQYEYGGEAVKILAQYLTVGAYAYLQFADNIKVLNNLFYDVAGQGVLAAAVPGTSSSTVRLHPSVWNLRVQGNIFLDCMQRMGDLYRAPRGAVALLNMSRFMPVMGGAESGGTFGLSYGTPPFRNLLFDRGANFEGIVLEDNCVWDSDEVTMPELALSSYNASASTVIWYNGTRVTATTSDAGRYTRTDLLMRNTLRVNPKVKADYTLEHDSPVRAAFNTKYTADAYSSMRDKDGNLFPIPKANMGPSQS